MGPTNPRAALDAPTPTAVWAAFLAKIDEQPAMGWARKLVLRRMDDRTAYLDTMPGCRDLRKFADQNRLAQIGDTLSQILDRPIRVQFEPFRHHTDPSSAPPPGSHSDRPPSPGADPAARMPAEVPVGGAGVLSVDDVSATDSGEAYSRRHTGGAASSTDHRAVTRVLSQDDRRQAMRLPLIKKVMELFDATLIGFHHVQQPASPQGPDDAMDEDHHDV